MDDTVLALLQRQAVLQPEAAYAIGVDDGHTIGYAELLARCAEVAALLDGAGVAPGETLMRSALSPISPISARPE